jgi:hypothetical protein
LSLIRPEKGKPKKNRFAAVIMDDGAFDLSKKI